MKFPVNSSSLLDQYLLHCMNRLEFALIMTSTLLLPKWYPGHIAKTEKELKEQLKLMDVVIEVRDARIPLATSHPQVKFYFHRNYCYSASKPFLIETSKS